MFKKLLNKKILKNQKGLTLIELLAVIVILAIVAAIAIPAIGNVIQNSRIKATKSDAINILNSANIFITDNPDITSITYDGGTGTFTNAPAAVTATFADSLQSLGAFEEVDFTIVNNAGEVGIFAANVASGNAEIDFGTAATAAGMATVTDIDSASAESDGTVVVVTD